MNIERDLIVVIGASFVEGWKTGEIAGFTFINKGVGGEGVLEMKARFQTDVFALRPRAVIIWGFINDIFRSRREEVGIWINKIKETLIDLVELAKRNGVIAILATELTIRRKERWSEVIAGWFGFFLRKKSYQDFVNEKVLAVNRWIREFAQTNDLILLDLQALLSTTDGLRKREFASDDGIHISPEGYQQISAHAEKILERYSNRLMAKDTHAAT